MNRYTTLLALSGLLVLAGPAVAQTFASAVAYTTGSSSYPSGVAIADLNGDGQPDIATSNDIANKIGVLPGNGTGTFRTGTFYNAGNNTGPSSVAVADLNGDGRPDIVTSNGDNGTASVLLSTGASAFAINPVVYGTGSGSRPAAVVLADATGDGKLDIVTANSYGNTVSVVPGMGSGTFGSATTYSTGTYSTPMGVAVADVNRDGRPDLVTANHTSNVVGVLLGTSTGALATMTTYSTGSNSAPSAVAVADINSDGKLDIIVTNYDASTVGVLLGTGTGAFGTMTSYGVGRDSRPDGVVLADVNGDGRLDIVTANYYNDSVGVLLSTGAGTFGAAAFYRTGSSPVGLAVADVNGDSKLDVVTANFNGNSVSVLLNATPLAARTPLVGITATVHPNPATNHVMLTLAGLPGSVVQVQTTLFDAIGRTVDQQRITVAQGTAQTEVSTAGLAAGLYVLRMAAIDAQGLPAGSLPTQQVDVR